MASNTPSPGLKRAYKSPSSGPSARPGNKRTRIEQACNNCRALRRKCNAGSPCSACLDNKLTCSYEGSVHPSERLTLAKAVKRIAHLEDRLRLYEGTAGESDGIPRYNTDVFSTRRTIDKPDDDMVRALRGVNSLTDDPRLPEFYGGSSSNVIIKAVESSESAQSPGSRSPRSPDPHSPENRALLWLGGSADLSFGKAPGPLLPARAVAEGYINCYFHAADRIFPILNRKLFVGTFNDFWNGLPTEGKGYEWWTAVMYMVIALGHQYSLIDADEELRSRATASPGDGEACFRLAKSSLSDVPFTGGDISAVNSLLLMFLWLYNQQRLHEAYTVIGLAANIGYGIGLHRSLHMDSENRAHIIGWCSSFWCLFTYQREMMALLGRPCVVQAREVDITPFSLETSPVDLQYVERMRQFAYVTWDTWDQVYSLAFKHSSVSERGQALRKADDTFVMWYNSWFHECTWGKEPHGLIVRLRFLHVRHLLYRAFLNLVVHKGRRRETISEDLLTLAVTCIHLALDITRLTVSSIHVGSRVSGTLQGVFFHALGYQWNATVTLMLYANSRVVQEVLRPKLRGDFDVVLSEIQAAETLFRQYADVIPFAGTAAQKISSLARRWRERGRGNVRVRQGGETESQNPQSKDSAVPREELTRHISSTATTATTETGAAVAVTPSTPTTAAPAATPTAATATTTTAADGTSDSMYELDFAEFDLALDQFDDYQNPLSLSELNFLLEVERRDEEHNSLENQEGEGEGEWDDYCTT